MARFKCDTCLFCGRCHSFHCHIYETLFVFLTDRIVHCKETALDGNLLLAFGHMEWAQQHARTVPQEVKHLACTLAAMQVICLWCLDFGMRESQELGMHAEKLLALLDYQHSLLSEQEVLVLRYAEAMSRTPVQVPDALFTALKAHNTNRQLVELPCLIAWEHFAASFNRVLGIAADG